MMESYKIQSCRDCSRVARVHCRPRPQVVSKRGGVMIANSMPVTRTVMEGGIRNQVASHGR
jgi:hypothetical protein